MADETSTAEAWLYSTLNGDATLTSLIGANNVHAFIAPQSATYPLVVFFWMGGHDVQGVGAARIMTAMPYAVKAVDRAESFNSVKPVAERIDALIHGKSGNGVLSCVREQPLKVLETVGSVQYRHLGGVYRIQAQ